MNAGSLMPMSRLFLVLISPARHPIFHTSACQKPSNFLHVTSEIWRSWWRLLMKKYEKLVLMLASITRDQQQRSNTIPDKLSCFHPPDPATQKYSYISNCEIIHIESYHFRVILNEIYWSNNLRKCFKICTYHFICKYNQQTKVNTPKQLNKTLN